MEDVAAARLLSQEEVAAGLCVHKLLSKQDLSTGQVAMLSRISTAPDLKASSPLSTRFVIYPFNG